MSSVLARFSFLCKITLENNYDHNSDEIDRYVNTELPFYKDDTLMVGWCKYSLIAPQLTLLAKLLFGVPASSATSEHIFGSSNQILEKGDNN